MLEVQKYLKGLLRKQGDPHIPTLDDLTQSLGIRVTRDEGSTLVALNYNQIESPKTHPLVMECRGLVLDSRDWSVVARSFTRFFNVGEALEQTERFDWSSFTAREKADGSLALLYYHEGKWRVNTRGSFGQGEIGTGVGKTWEQVFYEAMGENWPSIGQMTHGYTYVFELCSPFNKVVRRYPAPTLFLLACFRNADGMECSDEDCDALAYILGVRRPELLPHSSLNGLREWLETHEDPTYEGVVVRDKTGLRLKLKNSRYIALHRMRGEGDNLYAPKNLLPFILKGEKDELLTYFSEVTDTYNALADRLQKAFDQMYEAWVTAPHDNQKAFALHVIAKTPLASILFTARKNGWTLWDAFVSCPEVLLKYLAKGE